MWCGPIELQFRSSRSSDSRALVQKGGLYFFVLRAAPGKRPEGSNPLGIKPDVISQQQQAYPDIATLSSPLTPTAALARAQQVAEEMGWEIYRRDAGAGELEAVDTTTIMAFRDDIVVRVRGSIRGSGIDLRSVSRVGLSDMGKNAERIRDFQARFKAID